MFNLFTLAFWIGQIFKWVCFSCFTLFRVFLESMRNIEQHYHANEDFIDEFTEKSVFIIANKQQIG